MVGIFKCDWCGKETPADEAHVCEGGIKAGEMFVIAAGDGTGKSRIGVVPSVRGKDEHKMWLKPIMIHGYRLEKTCSACPEQYDVYAGDEIVAYFRLRHGSFRVDVPDCGGETIYTASPKGDGLFEDDERMMYLTSAILAVQEYYINRRWDTREEW